MDKDSEPELHVAVENNDVERLTQLLEAGEDPNVRGFRDSTPLHVAARDMRLECVRILLQYGADPNATSKLGNAPFHWGMATKVLDRFTGKIIPRTTPVNIEVLRLLVDSGADIHTKYPGLLHTAAGNLQDDNIAIVKFLIDNGHDPSGRDKWNKTPLGWAADHGSPRMVKFLLDQGSPLYALTHSLETALCRAVRRASDWESVDVLLKEHHKQQIALGSLNDGTYCRNRSCSIEKNQTVKDKESQQLDNVSVSSINSDGNVIVDVHTSPLSETFQKFLKNDYSDPLTVAEDLPFIDDDEDKVDILLPKDKHNKNQRLSNCSIAKNTTTLFLNPSTNNPQYTEFKNTTVDSKVVDNDISHSSAYKILDTQFLPTKTTPSNISQPQPLQNSANPQSLNEVSTTPLLLSGDRHLTMHSALEPSNNKILETLNLPLSLLSEQKRFAALITQERNYHTTDQDIRLCLRKGLGPNATTLAIIKQMEELKEKEVDEPSENKGMTFIRKHTPARLTNCIQYMKENFTYLKKKFSPPIKKVVPFLSGVLFCWISYYVDFGMDVFLAVQRLYDSPGTAALVLTWLFAFLPSIILNIRLCYERLSFFVEFEMDLVYKKYGFFKHCLVFYENRIAAVLICILQGWPALIYLQNYHVNELPIHIIPNNILTSHKERLKRMVRLVRQWEALLEATPQLFLQTWITMQNQQSLTITVALKLAMSVFSISLNLLKEEMLAKQVELPILGKIFLLLNFYVRIIARITSIILFTYTSTFCVALLYVFHVTAVVSIQIYEWKIQNPLAVGRPLIRLTEALSSIFNYIPKKDYEANVPIYSRLIFLGLMFLEDCFMLSLSYMFLVSPPYSTDFILYCFGVYFSSILVSFILLVPYYKAFHPWSWNVDLLRLFQFK